MGHRLSKTPRPLDSRHAPHEGSPTEPRPVLNLQLEDAPGQSPEPQPAPVASSACPRQIIIKIQLAKMEPGHDAPPAGDGAASPVNSSGSSNNNHSNSYNNGSSSSNNNNNNGTQFVNLTFDRSLACGEAAPPASEAPPSHNNNDGGNNNNNNNFHVLMGPMAELQLDEKRLSLASVSSSGSGSSSGADPGPEEAAVAAASSTSARRRTESPPSGEGEHCCRRKAKSSPFPARWRCCKCTCRDAFKRILDASSARGARRKERKEAAPQPQTPALVAAPPAASAPPTTNPAVSMSMWAPSASDVIIPISAPQFVVLQCPSSSLVTVGRIDDHAIRLTATELVPGGAAPRVLAPPPAPTATTTTTPAPAPTSTPAPPVEATPGSSSGGSPGAATPHGPGGGPSAGPVVHSQVDYIHCLVPDLEKITKASFYWGKMDRYEAERLLEGKPEGTFLLRDSAQEEYLFSVTFRKYGRSLHARIEQSNHKFSFDCHDPCVFTAPTVTGLLEHYKDPACVMFFEPMLTIPLHRSTTFSLQQLCRATIVSHTTYDGVTELELPARLKAYLKEYHYKQKLRVKPFDEPFYSCT